LSNASCAQERCPSALGNRAPGTSPSLQVPRPSVPPPPQAAAARRGEQQDGAARRPPTIRKLAAVVRVAADVAVAAAARQPLSLAERMTQP